MSTTTRLANTFLLLALSLFASCAAKYDRIMTYEQYRAVSSWQRPGPVVGHVTTNDYDGPNPGESKIKSTLLYYGSAHFSDPSDPQANEIEWHWDAFQPDVALNEGGDPPVAPTREEAISRYGEAGLLRFLAARDNVPIRSIDPTKQEEVTYLLQRHTPEELKVFFALRAVAQDAKREPAFREASPEACAEKVLQFYGRVAGLEGVPTTAEELAQSCARLAPQLADWREVQISWFDPAPDEPLAFTNTIARESSVCRDRYMVDLLETEMKQHQRVFAVVGLSHLVMQQPELESRLDGDFGWIFRFGPDMTIVRRMVHTSLLGRPLLPPPIESARREELERKVERYQMLVLQPDAKEDDFIWYARTLGYLHRYCGFLDMFNADILSPDGDDQVSICTSGLRRYPDSYKLLRHRGHRYITTRHLRLAVNDLSRAAQIIEDNNIPDEVEPDGVPNSRGVPRSTSHTNIYYHLGLARFLMRDYYTAAEAFAKCIQYSKNDDMLCAATHWLYWSLRRDGRDAEAQAALAPIRADMEIFENTAYYHLCLLYKHERTLEQLLPANSDFSKVEPALAYGVANWTYANGDVEHGLRLWRSITDNPSWPAFGVIASEVEIASRFPRPTVTR